MRPAHMVVGDIQTETGRVIAFRDRQRVQSPPDLVVAPDLRVRSEGPGFLVGVVVGLALSYQLWAVLPWVRAAWAGVRGWM